MTSKTHRNAPTDDAMCDAMCDATHEVEIGSPMALHDLRSLVFHWEGDPDAAVMIEFEGTSYPIAEFLSWDTGMGRPGHLVLIAGEQPT